MKRPWVVRVPYMRALQDLKDAANREIDAVQEGGRAPSFAFLRAVERAIEARDAYDRGQKDPQGGRDSEEEEAQGEDQTLPFG